MNKTKDALLYLLKRELSSEELEEVIEELKLTVYARENIPF